MAKHLMFDEDAMRKILEDDRVVGPFALCRNIEDQHIAGVPLVRFEEAQNHVLITDRVIILRGHREV